MLNKLKTDAATMYTQSKHQIKIEKMIHKISDAFF